MIETHVYTKNNKQSRNAISFLKKNGVEYKKHDLESEGITLKDLLHILESTTEGLPELLINPERSKKKEEILKLLDSEEGLHSQLSDIKKIVPFLKTPIIHQKRKERRGNMYYYITEIAPNEEDLKKFGKK